MTKSGTTAAQFLKIQVGARAIGMGSAYVAAARDMSAIYWNPAGLSFVGPNGGVNFVHTEWLADMQFDFAAVAIRAGEIGTFGLSFTSLSMPDMKVRTEFEPEGTGELFSAMDMALGLSYARRLTDRFSMGLTGKYVRQQIWHMTAAAVAFDIGILFRTDFEWLVLGMSISNFGPKLQYTGKDVFVNYDFSPDQWGDNENIFANLQTDKWDLPLMFRFGLAMEILKTEMNQLTGTVEARHPNDNTENLSFGMEYGFRKRFFLRGGYQALFEDKSEKGLTLGTGFVYFLSPTLPFYLDYAYADWGRLNTVHRFSAEIHF
ncbi:MAG: type IX secretion system outer membrane channel protein PorV [Calditrichia bacterium]